MNKRYLVWILVFLLSLLLTATVRAECTGTQEYSKVFSYGSPPNFPADGAKVWVPKEANCAGTYPLVIYLHGCNRPKLYEFGGGSPYDIINVAKKIYEKNKTGPAIFAAPSQVAGYDKVCSKGLWGSDFDIKGFVDTVKSNLPAGVQIGSIAVTGHSGAGMDLKYGIFSAVGKINPIAIGAFDTSMQPGLFTDLKKTYTGNLLVVYGTNRDKRTEVDKVLGVDKQVACPATAADTQWPMTFTGCLSDSLGKTFSFYMGTPDHDKAVGVGMEQFLQKFFPKGGTMGTTLASAPTSSILGPVQTSCTPPSYEYGTISNEMYDIMVSADKGMTSIIGIARMPLAVGIDKSSFKYEDIKCKPIPRGNKADMTWLKTLYGNQKLTIEPKMVEVPFTEDIKVKLHRRVAPSVICVLKAVEKCKEWQDYKVNDIIGYEWKEFTDTTEIIPLSSFGISIDINPDSNPTGPGVTGDLPQCLVDAFKQFGWSWGGDYAGTNVPAHFEFLADPSLIQVGTPKMITSGTQLPIGGGGPVGELMVRADTESYKCIYCWDMVKAHDTWYPDGKKTKILPQYECYTAKCPPNSVVNKNVKFYSQSDRSNPHPPSAECNKDSERVWYKNGCSSFSFRTALSAFNIMLTPEQVYCSAKHDKTSVYPSFYGRIKGATIAAGADYKSIPYDWNQMIAEIKQGKIAVFDFNDRASSVKTRPKDSLQHFVAGIGASADGEYMLINDVAGYLGRNAPNIVVSRQWWEQSVKKEGRVLSIIGPKQGATQTPTTTV